jgi:hypothetical protein
MRYFFYIFLVAIIAQVVVTVAAFKYLEWWQAIPASVLFFVVLVRGLIVLGKTFFKTWVNQIGEHVGAVVNADQFRAAEVDVHSIKPTPPPARVRYALDDPDLDAEERRQMEEDYSRLAWYQFDLSIYPKPGQAKPGTPPPRWQPSWLLLVPTYGTKPEAWHEGLEDALEMHDLRMMQDGHATPVEPSGPEEGVLGSQRLQFVAGVPRDIPTLRLKYHSETFGNIKLPAKGLGGTP